MRSTVKLAGVVAVAAVALTGCASIRRHEAAANAEQARLIAEGSVDAARRRDEYVKCVLDDAKINATERGNDAIEPSDLADVSLAKCGSLLGGSRDDFSMELFSAGQDATRAAAQAARTTATVQSMARGQAVALIVDVRRTRSAPPPQAGS